MSRNYTEQYPYGYYKGGGRDIDTSDRTQRERETAGTFLAGINSKRP